VSKEERKLKVKKEEGYREAVLYNFKQKNFELGLTMKIF
jgi:hypothetical protein